LKILRHTGIAGIRAALAALAIAALAAGCSGAKKPDKLTEELLSSPKEALFEKGKSLVEKKKYETGRKYLSFVFETYPNDPLGREALLLLADSYFKQGGTTGYTEARFRYRDYLNRYPGAPRRDYARYQFALCYDKEHERPDRDQTSTHEALDQYRALVREFPDTGYAGAARERIRQLIDMLAEHEFGVGYFYLRKGATAAALGRFTDMEQRFPEYGGRDKLLFYSAKALEQLGRSEEASRYYDQLREKHPDSEYAKKIRGKQKEEKPTRAASAAEVEKPSN
jgi:outer membrane protein assembly factor BamD